MRYYIRANGKLSSVTISDTLSDYLIAKTAASVGDVKRARKAAQRWINDLATSSVVPDKNVSQWVQARIIDFIVDPAIVARRAAMLERENARRQKLHELKRLRELEPRNA